LSSKGLPILAEDYPLNYFGSGIFSLPLSKDIRFVDYLNAQITLIGAREGKDVLKKEIGVDIEEEEETDQTADLYGKLQIEKKRTPVKALVESKFE
jgi:hypothetical protein